MKTLCILNRDNLPEQVRKTWVCETCRDSVLWNDAVESERFGILKCESGAFDIFEHRCGFVVCDFGQESKNISMVIVNHNNQGDGRPKYEIFTRRP